MSIVPGDHPVRPETAPRCPADRVLTAAVDLCTLFGINNVTGADIARLVGVDDRALQSEWGDLTDILTAAVTRDLHSYLDGVASRTGAPEYFDDNIIEAFTSVYWFLDGHPMVGGALRSNPGLIVATVSPSVAPVVAIAANIVVENIARLVRDEDKAISDMGALHELVARLTQSLLLTPAGSPPLTSRAESTHYARRCIVPLVHALIASEMAPDR